MASAPCDVLVVGSGGAALVAALSAAAAGARVRLLEKTTQLGGTTAISGGLLWIPGNPHMGAEGRPDCEADALAYLTRLALGRSDEVLVRTVVRTGPELIRFLESSTSLRFETLEKPDYHPELPGAREGGRCLGPNVFDPAELGSWRPHLRGGHLFSLPLSWRELDASNGVFHPERLDMGLIGERAARGLVGMGGALVGRLLAAVQGRGVEVQRETRALELLCDAGRVTGVRAETPLGERRFRAGRGVVLAAGGFEWSPELVRRFVAGPMTHPASCPSNEGDPLRMAMALGADLANMDDIMRFPTAHVPGERALPHSILVNRHGRRFANEAHNYTDMARAFAVFDPVAYEWAHQPCWSIFDGQFRERYAVLGVMPGDPDPEWLPRAGSLEELAARVGIDAAGLCETVARWNTFVARGVDPDFRRGESLFDRYYADFGREPSPTLGSLEKPPFFALRVHPGAIGSTGGPRIDPLGRVMHVSGEPIPGLFAAGDSAASTLGPGYGGPGGPLGQGMTMGYIAGRCAAGGS